ncbi:MAG: Holliday junction resolvase RuvX [Bacteroidetes bacterium]|nr:Holliday junction resolvase RuvX [Bacteroidota bacterium]
MGRILAIDYGTKRTGIAVTDPLKIIATSLIAIETTKVFNFLIDYCKKEKIETIVVGLPKTLKGESSENEKNILPFIENLKNHFINIPIVRFDERFTSSMAMQTLIDAGYKKKRRQDKKLLDSVAATLILQGYLLSIQ